MSLYPIYIDSSVSGAQLSIGTTNAGQINIGRSGQYTQIGNSRITNNINSGSLYLSTNSKNNNTTGYIGDYLLTTDDTWDSSIAEGTPIYARSMGILSGNTVFNSANGYRNTTAYGGDIVLRAGSSNSPSNNGTQPHTLRGGNVYIDGGTAWCQGGGAGGTWVTAVPGSIYFRTGKPSSGNTYYNDQVTLMTIANSGITTNVGMSVTGSLTTSGTLTVNGTAATPKTAFTIFSSAYSNYYTAPGYTVTLSISSAGAVFATEFLSPSDTRLKNIIKKIEIEDALKFIKNEAILFEWKKFPGSLQSGYKAQDVIKSGFGHLVTMIENKDINEETDEDGFVSPAGIQLVMNYNAVIPYHGVVIKHLVKENEELKNEQKIQQDKITSLESKVELLQKQMVDILQRLN